LAFSSRKGQHGLRQKIYSITGKALELNDFPSLSVLTFLPVAAALAVLVLGARNPALARSVAFASSLVALALSLVLWHGFDPAVRGFQFQETHAWVPSLAIQYHLGIDGLGLLMVMLSAIVVPMAMAASWRIEEDAPLYFSLVLLLQAGLFGTFTALNFFHWFIFWELGLVPAFFLIKLWGGPKRSRAATLFFVYTMVGSITLLLSFLALFLATGTFEFTALAELARNGHLLPALAAKLGSRLLSTHVALIVFAGAFLGFAVKLPLIPFHTWLPDAYAEAPIGTTMLLTGALSKMGAYGFLRILLPIFPEQMQRLRVPLLWLAVATIVLAGYSAFAQKDLKRIFAYSSINHLGYCALAIFAVARFTGADPAMAAEKAAALNGAFLQMFNHGLTAATLFWFVAVLEQRSGGLRGLHDFGGIRKVAPVLCGLMGIAIFSSLGLPGLNGFIGEFLIFKGVFPLASWAAALSTMGLLITAIFLLGVLQRVFSGPLNQRWSAMPDLSVREWLVFVPPIALMFVLGVYPESVLSVTNTTVMQLVKQLGGH
jgi:NADH-quinone oxidoreductase subunit M